MFRFVDRILEVDPGKRARGLCHLDSFEPLLTAGDPTLPDSGVPTVPPCLLGEAVGQLAAWAVMDTHDFELRPVGALIERVDVLGRIGRGETAELVVEIGELDNGSVVYHGSAGSRGGRVLEFEKAFSPLLPTREFDDPERLREAYGQLLNDGSGTRPDHAPPIDYACRVLEHAPGREIVAEKRFDGAEAFFMDHFPRRPVVPMTVLMECLLRLARRLLDEAGDETGNRHDSGAGKAQHIVIHNAKINHFIQPGDPITARIRLVEQKGDLVRFVARCEVGGRRTCQAKIDFTSCAP